MDALETFHPVVRTWFERRFPGGPTEPQAAGWPAVARGRDTLIAAPTGSGKTLAAFLVCIDRLIRDAEREGELADETRVVYVSPLKALATDIHHNLEVPLAEIRAVGRELDVELPQIRAQVRTGDTTPSARVSMLRRPPHLLITTPESLYLMVTAGKSRETLRAVRTVIVDEIHAVARDKRGAHLALTLERLAALSDRAPVRIGLSATQRPIEAVARLLVGSVGEAEGAADGSGCAVVDFGHRRDMDLALEVPGSELGPVASHEQWGEILDAVAAHVEKHRTTLVFVNTRRAAERVAHLLAERLGEDRVAAHHGSLSKTRRLALERRLRAGELRALVATASLELGIDIGPVELVCQIGSPRSFASLLQRVGRSGHARGATSKGRLYPTTRDELLECAALLHGVRQGRLDRLEPPQAPLDILAQQIVAACSAEPWNEADLYALVRRSAPFASLSPEDFDAVVELLSEGVATGRGRRGAYLHRDRVNGVLRGRRGARLAALTSGGAIPETADYRVLVDPDDSLVGTVNEDFAVESAAGDVFLLGSTSWRIRRVEAGVVRVTDARGAPPSIPFWLGEAPARTAELSAEVSALRTALAQRLEEGGRSAAVEWLSTELRLDSPCAEQIARYLEAADGTLGLVPTQRDIVFERFFDETGGMQLVVHAPFGGRINRALGLALRKRFCRSFDFELQAAASDDAVLLSLGPQHSFPLEDVPRFLSPGTIRDTLTQAVLASPMFAVRWRWNLGRSLLVLRRRGGRRNPPPLQRMQADDLLAALFPRLAACQENATGPVEIPDQPLVRQTLHDCLHEAMDLDGLRALLEDMEAGEVRVHLRDTTEPSLFAHEILNGRPYTFLDDAPLEERRSRAVALRRGLPESVRDLGRLDPAAIARVKGEVRPEARDPDELHDVLLGLVVLRPAPQWESLFEILVEGGRGARAASPSGPLWLATERRPLVEVLFPGASIDPDVVVPEAIKGRALPDPGEAAAMVVRGHLDCTGPITAPELALRTGLDGRVIEIALASLEAEGFALRGQFEERPSPDATPAREFCARRLLSRIHLYTQERLRSEIEPVSARDFMRFLLRWQHRVPGTEREGREGLLAVVEQLQGFELAAGAWERSVLPARVACYRREWLDELCLSGEVTWARLALPLAGGKDAAGGTMGRRGARPSRATPLCLTTREDLPWLMAAARGAVQPMLPGAGAAREVLESLQRHGALFHGDLLAYTGRLPIELEEGLWELVSNGLLTADGFQSVRSLLGGRGAPRSREASRGRRRKRGRARAGPEGRWALLPDADPLEGEELAEEVAEQLLARWGVVFREIVARERLALSWRELLYALRRMEARGTVRGGRFVAGFLGEQFALPDAVEDLRRTRRRPRDGERVRVSAADPLNLVGILTPGPRIPAIASRAIVFHDGLPEET
jgi:ATP-dependent Lhr-like helicase